MFFLCPPVCLFSEALQRSVRTLDLSSQSIDVICDQDVLEPKADMILL